MAIETIKMFRVEDYGRKNVNATVKKSRRHWRKNKDS